MLPHTRQCSNIFDTVYFICIFSSTAVFCVFSEISIRFSTLIILTYISINTIKKLSFLYIIFHIFLIKSHYGVMIMLLGAWIAFSWWFINHPVFQVLVEHLHIFFWDMPIQIICSFLIGLFVYTLLLSCLVFLFILKINLLLDSLKIFLFL